MLTKPLLNSKGFSLIEILVVFGIILVLVTSVIIYISPLENRKKARDQRRLADIIKLREAFEEFKADNHIYPDIKGAVRYSNIAVISGADISNASNGWLNENMSKIMEFLPTDPINSGEYIYTYTRDDISYELNVKLEYSSDIMQNDNGNNENLYEVGDNLTLLL